MSPFCTSQASVSSEVILTGNGESVCACMWLGIIAGKLQTHLNDVPVVCELLQWGWVEAEG